MLGRYISEIFLGKRWFSKCENFLSIVYRINISFVITFSLSPIQIFFMRCKVCHVSKAGQVWLHFVVLWPWQTLVGDSRCLELKEQPPSQVQCVVPCADDCVLSEWTEWSECPRICQNNMFPRPTLKHRTRTILAKAAGQGPCSSYSVVKWLKLF